MIAANLPRNEAQRLKRLRELMVLDSLPEPLFDEITKLASEICNTPIALISLVDENRQWFKSNIGLEDATETGREVAFCSHTILQSDIFEIPDAALDNRFKDNPLVIQEPNIRFYAGAPITLPKGERIGTLCVIDQEKNKLNTFQKSILKGLAKVISQALIDRQIVINKVESNTNKLAAIVHASSDAIISKNLDGTITSWNQGAEAIFSYSAKEMIGESILCLIPKKRKKEEAFFINQIKNGILVDNFETQRITKSGQLVDVSVSLSPIKNANGAIIGIAKIARDITQEKRFKTELASEHQRLHVTMKSIGDAVVTTSLHGEIEYLNPAAEALTGWSLAEANGKSIHTIFNIINADTRQASINPIDICLKENKPAGLADNTTLISKDGREYGIEDSATPIRDEAGNTFGAVLVFRDVTAQRKMASEMAYRSSHDLLTGLYNRSEFESRLRRALKQSTEDNSEHALMFINLDQFKIINDTCGHATGDRLLKEIAHIMHTQLRASDTLCRLGGDEFAILLEKCHLEPAMRVAQQICKSIERYRISHDKKRYSVSSSIGLLLFNQKWKSVEQLIQSADAACYAAKDAGRNRVHLYYDADFSAGQKKDDSYWASRIGQALEENRFILYGQRILPTNKKLGIKCEVLLRMIDEHGAIVTPNTFLPAAEKFHLMSRIDKWVVKHVLSWLSAHKMELTHVEVIAINLSGQSISDPSFHQYILDLISNLSLDCAKLCFEITETAAITNIDVATKFINTMRAQQVKFSLDDFGSGVSSFGYLKSLPVDFVKIDGQFIQNISNNDVDQAMVRCIVDVAKLTNKQTVAEWVETEDIEQLLHEMKVDYIQGFLRHKPAPLHHLLKPVCTYVN